jgi:hypothetical protein
MTENSLTRQVDELAPAKAQAAFEMSPLFEHHWSGIPIVTAQIAKYCLADAEIDWKFLYGSVVVPHDLVELLLLRRSGAALTDRLIELAEEEQLISLADAGRRACIWPNVKSMAGKFAREAFIVHDLSTLLMPEYHHGDSIAHHANRIMNDCQTSEHVFCVSEATRSDVVNYLGVPLADTSVLPLGVDYDEADLFQETLARQGLDIEPYIVVLGTIEPRKNGRIVIEMLARNPAIARHYRCVFIGRDGWLDEKERLLAQLREAGVPVDRVVFTGFVDDSTKLRLLLNCSFAIYPSFFEGFGLPVLEAAVLGKICVASNTSSIVEVAPDSCIFFDPTDAESLAVAVQAARVQTTVSGSAQLSYSELMANIATKGWDRTYAHIRQWVLQGALMNETGDVADPGLPATSGAVA